MTSEIKNYFANPFALNNTFFTNMLPTNYCNFTIPNYSTIFPYFNGVTNLDDYLDIFSNNLQLNNTIFMYNPLQYSLTKSSTNNIFGKLNENTTIPPKRTNPTTTLKMNSKAKKVHLDQNFVNGVKQIAKEINCDYKDLLAVMNLESGLNPSAYNKTSGASGLIQFMPKTAQKYGITTQQMRNMNPTEQLPYIRQYLIDAKKMAGFFTSHKLSSGDLYSLVFLPARAKQDVLCVNSEKYYQYNKGIDKDHDGKITKQDINQMIYDKRVDIA